MAGCEEIEDDLSMETGENVVENDTEPSQITETEKHERIIKLPIARIKHIIKLDPDVTLASQDAVIMIAKAVVILGL